MSARINYNRITGSNIQGDATTVTEPLGTLVVTNNNELRLHDGSTAGGNSIGGGGGVGSFGTDKGIGADYASNNPAILFSDDDMIIRTGGTAGHGTIGAMYIASAEELIIGHTDASLTDATSLGAGNFTDYLQIDTNGIEMTTARGTVQFGYNLEAPGVPTHFHINKLNQSFDLFFGDDSNYFHLPAGGGSPVIGANDGSSGQKLWTFGQDGSLTFPNGAGFGLGENGQLKVNDSTTLKLDFRDNGGRGFYTDNGGFSLRSNGTYTWTFGQDGTLNLPDSASAGTAIIQTTSAINIQVNSNAHTWTFGTDGTLIVPGEIKSEANTGPVIINSTDGNTTKTWTFGGDGSITFPDATVQTTAYRVMSLPPLTAWGTVVSFDNLSFSFDATTGSPGFNGGYGQGSGSYSTLIWTADLYQQLASPTNLTISSGEPVQYFNYNGPNLITEVALTPGDSFVLRIQDVDTNRVYRATFLASFKAADAGNEGKYGAITVERLV